MIKDEIQQNKCSIQTMFIKNNFKYKLQQRVIHKQIDAFKPNPQTTINPTVGSVIMLPARQIWLGRHTTVAFGPFGKQCRGGGSVAPRGPLSHVLNWGWTLFSFVRMSPAVSGQLHHCRTLSPSSSPVLRFRSCLPFGLLACLFLFQSLRCCAGC